jgi:transposase
LILQREECRPKIPEILADPFFHGKYIPRALSSRYLTEQPQQIENLTPKKTPLNHKKRKLSDVDQLQV